MSRDQRLKNLEAVLARPPADRSSYCRDCGGMTIEEALTASETLETVRERVSRREAKAVLAALDEGEPSCRRCGRETLAGALSESDVGGNDDTEETAVEDLLARPRR
jgi:hypothetical protein